MSWAGNRYRHSIRAGNCMAGDAFPEAVLFAADAFMHRLITLVIQQ